MWHLIYNKLNILIDPYVFGNRSSIEKQVELLMVKDYLPKTEPSLCDVIFYYPKYLELRNDLRSIFAEMDDDVSFVDEPLDSKLNYFNSYNGLSPEQKIFYNELLSIALKKKIPYILSTLELDQRVRLDIKTKFNISFIDLVETKDIISYFLQGFYNYYKFSMPIYGLDTPEIAHSMSDELHKRMYLFQNEIDQQTEISDEIRERVRSFVHNRYIDILVTIDRINFYRIQQKISDIERSILENKKPHYHGSIRYYLNYYLLLVWGYTDHFTLILNDIFSFGYDVNNIEDRKKIGLKNTKSKKEFLCKIKETSEPLYSYIISNEFQEWLDVLGQMRHKNAHREMISPSVMLGTTPESQLTDEEIDAILYKENPPIDDMTYRAFLNTVGEVLANKTVDQQKIIDRTNYRIAKSNKLFDHFVIVEKDGEPAYMDPVARIEIDISKIREITSLLLDAYGTRK